MLEILHEVIAENKLLEMIGALCIIVFLLICCFIMFALYIMNKKQ